MFVVFIAVYCVLLFGFIAYRYVVYDRRMKQRAEQIEAELAEAERVLRRRITMQQQLRTDVIDRDAWDTMTETEQWRLAHLTGTVTDSNRVAELADNEIAEWDSFIADVKAQARPRNVQR